MAQSQTPRRKLEQGRYIVIDACSGMVLDLSGVDDRTLIAFGLHGGANQQARALSLFSPRLIIEADCGHCVRDCVQLLLLVGVPSLRPRVHHQQRQK